ncbi:MAG TPA: hypothetical protein VLY63_12335, partial [Anaerolineae bacterium]|nr:hypothetical protein [Anaerolineae bacterium]
MRTRRQGGPRVESSRRDRLELLGGEVPAFQPRVLRRQNTVERLALVMGRTGIPNRLCVLVLPFVLACGLGVPSAWAADESAASPPAAASPVRDPIEQALVDLQSEEAAVRAQAADVLIAQGDASLIPRLDELREGGSRVVRI